MPFRTVTLSPGVNIEATPTLNKVQLAVSNLIRFYSGLAQKLGGWLELTAQTFLGTCTGLHGWADILGNPYLAIGTEQRLQLFNGGEIDDITPLAATTNPSVAFSTVIHTSVVTIDDGGYAPSAGDWINLLTQVSVGGIVLFGFYQVQTIIDATHYTITAASNATATVTNAGAVPDYATTMGSANVSVTLANHGLVIGSPFDAAVSTTVATVVISGIFSVISVTSPSVFVITAGSPASTSTTGAENGGAARIEYLIPTGFAVDTLLTGYGIGDYGAGDYGLSDGSEAFSAPLRQWSLDHWGQDLVASPTNGGIYYWQPPVVQPATVMPNAPLYSTAIFVMPQVQIIVSLGSELDGTQEPLLSRWCDQGDFTDWTATATNQAGSFFYPTGSKLVGGLATGLGAFVWSDVDLWSMAYLGFPLVFGFNRIAPACGLIAQRAAGTTGSLVMWLSTRGFFVLQIGGGVTSVECPVWDFLINNIDMTQLDQTHCAVNSLFNEMAWLFPIMPTSSIYSAQAPLGYVKFNYVENCWDYGQSSQYQRTAWVGRTPVGNPIGADYAGLLQQHEIGWDANGAAMVGGWQTGNFDLTEGEDFPFIDLIIPDFTLDTTAAPPVISMLLTATNFPLPSTAPVTVGPFTINTAPGGTQFIPCRVRAREISLAASWSDLGSFNRIGAIRYRYAPDGRV